MLVQQWLDLAPNRSNDGAFLSALKAFNNLQMQKKTKLQEGIDRE